MSACLVCKDEESTSFSYFCYNHVGPWLSSPERSAINTWNSDEEYNQAVDAYVQRVFKEKETAGDAGGDSVRGASIGS